MTSFTVTVVLLGEDGERFTRTFTGAQYIMSQDGTLQVTLNDQSLYLFASGWWVEASRLPSDG